MKILKYLIKTQIELNLSYMPFIKGGGLFIPSHDKFQIGEPVTVELQLPGTDEIKMIEGLVVWITPINALYQIYRGIGIQFSGDNASTIHDFIKANLDNTMDVGGYAYGIVSAGKE